MARRSNRRRREELTKRSLPPVRFSNRRTDRTRRDRSRRSRSPVLASPVSSHVALNPYFADLRNFYVSSVAHPVNVNKAKVDRKAKVKPLRYPTISTTPEKTICESRSERKQVMFATGSAGRKGQRTPMWTQKSKVRCK